MAWLVDILVAQGQPSWKQGSPVTTKPHLYDYMPTNKALYIKDSKQHHQLVFKGSDPGR